MMIFRKIFYTGAAVLLMPLCSLAQDTRSGVVLLKDSLSNKTLGNRVIFIQDVQGRSLGRLVTTSQGEAPMPASIIFPCVFVIEDSFYHPFRQVFPVAKDTFYIRLSPRRYQELKEVTVTTAKKALRLDARGAELDITRLKNAAQISVADALEQIPGVVVDRTTGDISYQGKAVAIVKDGIAVAGFADLVRNTINTFRANTYEKVSINLYDLKTEQPTISFEAPKFENGIMSNLAGVASLGMLSTSISATIARGKHLIFISTGASGNFSPQITLLRDRTQFISGIKTSEQMTQSGARGMGLTFSVGDNIAITRRDILNFSFNYSASSNRSGLNTQRTEFRSDTVYSDSYIHSENENRFRANPSLVGNFAYIHKFIPRKLSTSRFDIAVNYRGNRSVSEAQYRATVREGEKPPGSDNDVSYDKQLSNIFTALTFEYKHQHLGNFEAVAKYFNRNIGDQTVMQVWGLPYDSLLLQKFRTHYHYTAILLSWDKQWKPFSARVVLKQDYSVDKAVTALLERPRFTFQTFSPYLSLNKSMGQTSIRLEAQTLPSRPMLEFLTTLVNYADLYGSSGYIRKGNPELQPYNQWKVGTVYTFPLMKISSIQLSLNYTHSPNMILAFRTIEDGMPIASFRNIGGYEGLSTDTRATINPFDRFQVIIQPHYTYAMYKETDAAKRQYTHSYRISSEVAYNFTPVFRLGIRGDYSRLQSFQYVSKPSIMTIINAGYTKPRVMLNLMIMNAHRPFFNQASEVISPAFSEYFQNRMRQLGISVTFGYQLTKTFKKRPSEQGKAVIADDMR